MSIMMNEPDGSSADSMKQAFHVALSRGEVALIIDALLQAEMTLPLIDKRYRAMKAIESLRTHQLDLANRLEDLISDTVSELGQAKSTPPGKAEQQP